MTHCAGRIFPHAIDEWAICDTALDQDWADLLVDEYPHSCASSEAICRIVSKRDVWQWYPCREACQ